MKTLTKAMLFICIVQLVTLSKTYAAYTYNWTGGTSTVWELSTNWSRTGSGGTSTCPGQGGSVSDIVQIGVTTTFTRQPVLANATTIASLTIGTATATTLTINAALTVSGDVTQKNNSNAGGITTNLTGAGSLSCTNFYLGDSTVPPLPTIGLGLANATYQTILNFSSLNLAVSQNLYITTTTRNANLLIIVPIPSANVNNPIFNFNSGTISVGNALQTVDTNDINLGAFLIYVAVSNSAEFLINPSAGNASALNLNGANSISLDGNAGYVDLHGTAGGTSTVTYGGAGNQEVYTSSTAYSNTRQSPSGLDRSPSIYQNLVFTGALTKTADAGNLTVGANLTLAASGTETVDFATNSPIVTAGGNYAANTGATLNQGGTGTMTIAGTSNNAGTLNQTGSGNITFTGALNNSVLTAIIAQTGTGGITASNGISNAGTISQGSGTIGAIAVTGALTNTGTVSQTSGNITVSSDVTNSGSLNLGTANLNIGGNYNNSGTYAQSTGTTLFNGASAQNLQDGSIAGTLFKTVSFSGTGAKTITSGSFAVASTSVLTMIGSSTLAAGGFLTLNSDASGSATVAAIPSGASITGNVNVQRFITGGSSTYRGYRLLSSPVTQGSSIYSINYLINSCYLTGTTGPSGGFDKAGNPTLYLYRENLAPLYTTFLNSNFRGINTISTSPNYLIDVDGGPYNIPVGNGYLFFFRGDRNIASLTAETTTTYIPTNTTLTATGVLNAGAIAIKDWYTAASPNLGYTTTTANSTVRGLNLVGNPYASSINWDTFSSSSSSAPIYGPSVASYIYVLDPVSKNYGVYVAGVPSKTGTNNSTNIIASGQGFFVQATCSCAQLVFNESSKINTQPIGLKLLMGMPVNYSTDEHLRIKLLQDSINTDDILISFTDSSKKAYAVKEDALYKIGMGSVSLSSMSADSVALAINTLPLNAETIRLNVNTKTNGTYQLQMKEIVGIPQLYGIWLKDKFTSDSVNMRTNNSYSFTINKSDSSSFGANRLAIVIRQDSSYSNSLQLTVQKVPNVNHVQIAWNTKNNSSYSYFIVQRSIDNGKTYNALGTIKAASLDAYNFLDKNPVIGQNLYRLKEVNNTQTTAYSKVVSVLYSDQSNQNIANNLNIYPNPSSNNINLLTNKKVTGTATYNIKFTSNSGAVVKQITSPQPSWQGNISDLKPGIYIVYLINNTTQNVVGEAKFVKL